MMDGDIARCVMTIVLLQLASGFIVIPHEIKLHMDNQCVCFRFEMIHISVEMSRSLSSAHMLCCVCISGLFVHHHRVYIYFHVYFYIGASAAFFFILLPGSVQVSLCKYMCN